MLKITMRSAEDSGPVLTLDGSLRQPWIAELESCLQSLPDRESLKLDLSGLTFADAQGTKVLAEAIRRGAELIAGSGYVAALLQMEKS